MEIPPPPPPLPPEEPLLPFLGAKLPIDPLLALERALDPPLFFLLTPPVLFFLAPE